jgi:AcrR family transcriptional regulator
MTKIRDRDQVIDVAAKVFAEKGFEAARLEDIAAELGVLQGSLYYHIANKAELLLLVQQRRLMTIAQRVREIVESGLAPEAKLALAIREHLAHLERYHPESAQWFTTPARANPSGAEESERLNREYAASWVELIEDGIRSGSFRSDVEAGVVARGILGMCNWLPRWYQKDGALPLEEIARMLTAMVSGGLAAPAQIWE